MEKYIDMKSPLTGGRVKEVSTMEEKIFRKEKFRVHVRYCVCEDSGNSLPLQSRTYCNSMTCIRNTYKARHTIS